MTERVEVRTKAEAEKAIKAGKAINIVAGVFALTLTDVNVSIWISGDSAPSIVTRGTSAPSIVTRETSAPSIVTWGTSAPRIETWGTSAPRIETWETSAPSIDANGYSYAYIRGDRLTGCASANVLLRIQGKSKIDGGQQFHIELQTAQDWCDFYGVRIEEGCAVVYKAVGAGYVSYHGATYTPGTMPADPKWDGKKRECKAGGGLNFSPTPLHTLSFVSNPKHFLECRIRLDDDFAVHFDGSYPEKCCHKEVAAPIVEVDIDGNPIERVEA